MQKLSKRVSSLISIAVSVKGGSRLFGASFYSVLDRKATSRKRAKEMSRDIRGERSEPPAKRPFHQGPSESSQAHPRGSSSRGGKKSDSSRGRGGSKTKTNRCVTFFARQRVRAGRNACTHGFATNANDNKGSLQSPRCYSRSTGGHLIIGRTQLSDVALFRALQTRICKNSSTSTWYDDPSIMMTTHRRSVNRPL